MNTNSQQSLHLPSTRGLLLRLGVSAAIGLLITVCFILPAEFNRDPTGIGQLLGLTSLSQQDAAQAAATSGSAFVGDDSSRLYFTPFRTDEIEIPVGPGKGLEYKVKVKTGGTFVYSWESDKEIYYDFHGEQTSDPTVARSYIAGSASEAAGSLVAPFEGIHGWFLRNDQKDPIQVHLQISGFYELR
jgi:hypothetical protein